ncbi:c-type cytochrome [Bernardetia sp.]|uniref:c-type cytochrome n=1 Tax=Bernardetia sp. TaxID=1937974 RepID=UPI0025C0F9C9|nr:cytochrome c [Bernardetia sp.]
MKLFNIFTFSTLYTVLGVIGITFLTSCGAEENYPGVEYAPQMYHSVPYEPLSQVIDNNAHWYSPIDNYFNTSPASIYGYYTEEELAENPELRKKVSNMLMPPVGTVKRQKYLTESLQDTSMFYEIHRDSVELAAKLWKSPIAADDEQALAHGKELFLTYCAACHGKEGKGDGKVGAVYNGVPNYTAGRYKTLNEGWIFHVITYGKGRMWPVKVQLNPEERWKVVRYVQQLQQGKP